LLAQSGYGGVQRNPVHPGGNFGIASKGVERLPKLKHDFLKKVIACIPVRFIQVTNLVDQPLVFIYQVYKVPFLFASQRSCLE
jgi:hypothetical protein